MKGELLGDASPPPTITATSLFTNIYSISMNYSKVWGDFPALFSECLGVSRRASSSFGIRRRLNERWLSLWKIRMTFSQVLYDCLSVVAATTSNSCMLDSVVHLSVIWWGGGKCRFLLIIGSLVYAKWLYCCESIGERSYQSYREWWAEGIFCPGSDFYMRLAGKNENEKLLR